MCYDDNARVPQPHGAAQPAETDDGVLTAGDGNQFSAFTARTVGGAGAAVLIMPDVRGLHRFYKDLATRFAEQGVDAVAMDYFGRTAGLDSRDDSFEFMPHVQKLDFSSFQVDVAAALAHLRAGAATARATYTLGFCMGGSLSLMTGTQEAGLAGVVGFYAGMSRNFGGAGTLLERAAAIKVPVLGLFGGADQGISAEQVAALDHQLDQTGVTHEIITYPDAPHSFFDRRQTEFAAASADAWARVLAFMHAHAAPRA